MVSWIMGPSRSGKTKEVYRQMQRVISGGKRVFLLVPEQYSFEREQEIQRRFSYQNSGSIQVLSFSRLADRIFKEYGGFSKDHATKTIKILLMHKTLQKAAPTLHYYSKSIKKPGFHSLLVQAMDEMQNAAVDPSEFSGLTGRISQSQLREKAEDIASIYDLYQSLLQEKCRDPLSDLRRAVERVKGTGFFKDVVVFVEDFLSFNGTQIECLAEMIEQTDIAFSLCYQKGDSLFTPSEKTYNRICKLAKELGSQVNPPLYLQEEGKCPEDLALIKNRFLRFSSGKAPQVEGSGVHLYLAANEYAEVDRILADIWELVQKKQYRFRDILLLSRDIDSYRGILESGCKRYGIPYYLDKKIQMENQPLFRCILGLLTSSAKRQIDIGALLQTLKSGMTKFSHLEIAHFENYIFTWKVSGKQLQNQFSRHPRGYLTKEEMTEFDSEALKAAEEVRVNVVEAVQVIKSAGNNTQELTEALLEGLNILGVTEKFEKSITDLQPSHPDRAQELIRLWDAAVDILETIDQTLQDAPITLAEYAELFSVAVGEYSLGTVPQTMDSVMISPANHVSSGDYKAVFIFGANEGVFPYVPTVSGIFSTRDRECFRDLGVELSKPMVDWIAEERLIAYQALCKPSEQLFLSARQSDISGNPYEPSEVFYQAKEMFGDSILQTETDPLYLSRNQETAFLQLAYNYRSSEQSIETLRQYFSGDSRLNRLDLIKKGESFRLEKPDSIQKLLGSVYLLSPTQVERFYQCPFSYFCANALKVYPRQRAELGGLSIGSMVHFVLENMLKNPSFLTESPDDIKGQIKKASETFLQERIGNLKSQPASILSQAKKIEQNLFILCRNIQKELNLSGFKPKALESSVSGSIYESSWSINLDGKEQARVIGTMDRVDGYHLDGKEYLRVIDYKSGAGKKFQLSDIYHGLNLQMLLYLFSQCSGQETLPAGALYLPTSGCLGTYALNNREVSEEEVSQTIDNGFRMNGVMLDSPEILDAMEKLGDEGKGQFVPIVRKKDAIQADSGGVLVSVEQLEILRDFVNKKLSDMCAELKQGEIGAIPLIEKSKQLQICDFCAYRTVCGFREGMPCREKMKFKNQEFFEIIQKEEEK